jgi:hypothetical protein
MIVFLKRLFTSCLAGFCITLLLWIIFRVLDPTEAHNRMFLRAENLILLWPTRLPFLGFRGV